MGIFNLLRTPKMQIRYYTTTTGSDFSTTYTQNIAMRLASDVQYVINPASGLEVQQIQASIVGGNLKELSGTGVCSGVYYEGNNATYGHQYRTIYRDLGCWSGTIYSSCRTVSNPFEVVSASGWRIKVVVNFKRKDATSSTQNVMFVATYPITTEIVRVNSAQDPAFVAFKSNLPGCRSSIPAVSASSVNTFCNSSEYKTSQRKFARYNQNLQKMEQEERRQQDDAINMLPNPQENGLTVYPNPATEYTTLQYQVPVASAVRITLQGVILNRTEVLLENDQHQAGYFEKRIDTSSLAKGVYFCSLTINGHVTTKKLIVQ